MPCQAPIPAWQPVTGGQLQFNAPTNGRAYHKIDIPCGYCILCREEEARQQAVRITHEASLYDHNAFITLTYDDEHLPEHNSLNYHDLKKFIKRVRKRLGHFRYYAVGEYGDRTNRPHYHLCVFGHGFNTDKIIIRETPTRLWTQTWLQLAWGLGNVSIGALTFETARYTASYVTKKLRSKQTYVRVDTETGLLVPLEQPKSLKTDNLGKRWLHKWMDQVIQHDYVIINGKRQKPPKAYDKWLKELSPSTVEDIKKERKRKAKQNKLSEQQRHARAKNAHARLRRKAKKV